MLEQFEFKGGLLQCDQGAKASQRLFEDSQCSRTIAAHSEVRGALDIEVRGRIGSRIDSTCIGFVCFAVQADAAQCAAMQKKRLGMFGMTIEIGRELSCGAL